MLRAPTSATSASEISSAGAALDQQLSNLVNTFDWSWSKISRPPSCTSTRTHQDRTGVAGATAWIVLTMFLAKQSGQLLADKWMRLGHRVPPLHQSLLESSQLEPPCNSSCTNYSTHATGLGLRFQDHQVVHQQELIRISPGLLLGSG